VSSLVEDLIMPPIGLLLGHVNFSELFINLSGKSNSVINFLIVAFAVFLIVHEVNRWTRKPEAPRRKIARSARWQFRWRRSAAVTARRSSHEAVLSG
jgi:large conductance mechanosensitive channel protein